MFDPISPMVIDHDIDVLYQACHCVKWLSFHLIMTLKK